MCGIAGFVSKRKDKDKIIKAMCDKIKHRGPDGEGYYVDDYVALGQRRLSIIDIEGGKQPMYSNDGNLVVIFNGEIYNYQELKEELDYDFKTSSDTEVLIAGYLKWGKKLPEHLRGMFAFVIYDKENNTLFGARDPFGIKPFYYYMSEDNELLFASEIKAFLANPSFKKELNEDILAAYMSFSFTPTNETFFKGVKRLDAGCSLYFDGNINIEKYYKLEFNIKEQSYEDAVNKIDEVMRDSVKHHLISDVEVGSFLSSGVDSSYLVSLAKPDKTYTIGYDEDRYDESKYTKDLCDRLHIHNKVKKISEDDYINAIDDVLYYMDEPTSDPAIVSLYYVAKEASKDVKVVLSGEGADEFFGGYNSYREEVDFQFYNKIPFFIRHFISSICKHLPRVRGINFLIRRGEKLEDNYIGVNKVWSDTEIKKILKIDGISNKEITKPIYDEFKSSSNIVKMQAIDINFWLMKDILQKADRMTMASSLEGRVPFIDYKVFDVSSSLPFNYKVTKENTKVALRDAAKRVIPNKSYMKKKLGFPVPVRDWMRDDKLYNIIKKSFETETAKKYFDTDKLLKMLDDHKNKKQDNYRKIWNIYCFLEWYKVYFS